MSEISERIKSRLDRSKGLTQANLARDRGLHGRRMWKHPYIWTSFRI